MEWMEQRILHDGHALDQDILLVDSFLNHQVDMTLMQRVGNAFAAHFAAQGITRILTIESSGIAPAGQTALAMGIPLVVCKKKASKITNQQVYQTQVQSFTKGTRYELTISRDFLPPGERVLFIDDFLAMGEAALGMDRLMQEASCTLAGIGIVIEKAFQPGREKLARRGYDVFSLARVASMSAQEITFVKEA